MNHIVQSILNLKEVQYYIEYLNIILLVTNSGTRNFGGRPRKTKRGRPSNASCSIASSSESSFEIVESRNETQSTDSPQTLSLERSNETGV